MLNSVNQLKNKGREAAPMLDQKHVQVGLFLGSVLFAISLSIGVMQESLGFLCESLLLVTLMWAIYRGSFPAALILMGYLIIAKTYQLIFFDHLNLILRSCALALTVLLARGFYLATAKKTEAAPQSKNIFDLFDILFAMTISLVAISISAVAIENYELKPSNQSVSDFRGDIK